MFCLHVSASHSPAHVHIIEAVRNGKLKENDVSFRLLFASAVAKIKGGADRIYVGALYMCYSNPPNNPVTEMGKQVRRN